MRRERGGVGVGGRGGGVGRCLPAGCQSKRLRLNGETDMRLLQLFADRPGELESETKVW